MATKKNVLEIKFDDLETTNIYVKLNDGQWYVKRWNDLDPITRMIVRGLAFEHTEVKCDPILFE